LDAKKEVKMLGFTLNRFVVPNKIRRKNKKNERTFDIGGAIKKAIEENGAKVRLLLLKRTCSAATERIKIESEGEPQENIILLNDSVEVENYWKDTLSEKGIELKYYETPYAGMVIFDDEAFIELYHLGSKIKDQNICGHVPILKVKKLDEEEALYEMFESHFENVWEAATKPGLPGSG
jgi:hypothetical protein